MRIFMSYPETAVKKADELIEARRKRAEQTAAEHTELVYEKCPMIKEIDHALSLTGLNVYRAALMGKDGLEERMAKLKKENLDLQNHRKELLKQNGFAEDFTEVKYTCPKCRDTGYVGVEMCSCKRKALAQAAFESAGLGSTLKHQGFENFDLDFYSDKAPDGKLSPRQVMSSILEKSKKYVSNFGNPENASNLLFIGKTGLGKTHLTTAIARGIIEKGYDVVYESAQNIIRAFELSRFERDENAGNETDRFFSCDLLIIDDLGTEFVNSFTQSVLYNLINTRINGAKPMIISTNLDNTQLFKKTYDDRITSRLIGSFRSFRFEGSDIRIQKAKAK